LIAVALEKAVAKKETKNSKTSSSPAKANRSPSPKRTSPPNDLSSVASAKKEALTWHREELFQA
jgi:hypothetical protein